MVHEDESEAAPLHQIGPYKILEEIGRGGMGTVYLAERAEPHQQVAIKIIRRGMDTDEIVRRFRRERQLLAALSHPNIARLLDGASTDDGLPYFVMEYIVGQPITHYCDQRKLAINERLALFKKICKAVSCIHRNLIVHRDIKPSNILITDEGEPKLLDFGIAKLLAPRDLGDTVDRTMASGRLLTPEYASPEQINGDVITTASDIYSLGVVLYELLCGHRPIETNNGSAQEVLRAISQGEPTAPSTAVLMTAEISESTGKVLTPETVAGSRSERPAGLKRRLSGDLDNITLKALKKEPDRRYQTVDQFVEDIERHLAGRPVLARPDTWLYRSTKFIKRNRVAAGFIMMLLLVICIGLAGVKWQSARAERQRALTKQRTDETRRLANSLLKDFAAQMGELPGSYPMRVTLAETASAYLNNLSLQNDDQDLLIEVGEAHFRLSDMYGFSLADPQAAASHLKKASDIARRLLMINPGDLRAKDLLAKTLESGGGDLSHREQDTWLRLQLREGIVAAKPPDLQKALNALGSAYWGVGDMMLNADRKDEARLYHQRALDTYQQQVSLLEGKELNSEETAFKFWAHVWLGMMQGHKLNDWPAAIKTAEAGLRLAESLQAQSEDPDLQATLHMAHNRLAIAYENNGEFARALDHYLLAMESNRAVGLRFHHFWQHTQTRYLLRIVAMHQKLGDNGAVVRRMHEAIDLRREITRTDQVNPRNKHAHASFFAKAGEVFAEAGQFDEALAAYEEAEMYWKAALSVLADSPAGLETQALLAHLNTQIGDLYSGSSPDSPKVGNVDLTRLRSAQDWYAKSVASFTAIQNSKTARAEYLKELELVRQKLEACETRLKSVSASPRVKRRVDAQRAGV